MVTPAGPRYDVFCRVVDNYGDAGVALRLSRQLACEHGIDVTLWIDDVAALARIRPAVAQCGERGDDGVRVRRLPDQERGVDAPLPDVVIEAFGCGLPGAYLERMTRAQRPPVWLHLEYLSAEDSVDTMHGLPSPHPPTGIARWFVFPGFARASGGLLRERGLFAERDAFVRGERSRSDAWTSLGLPAPARDALHVSLFCYPNAALVALLRQWRDGDKAIACLVPQDVASGSLAEVLGASVPHAGHAVDVGALRLGIAPFVDQNAFDRRLWTSDFNIVRGEDSFVRAQWAAKPFAWHIYPQAERAHLRKLAAFTDRYAERLPATARSAMLGFWSSFNDEDGPATAAAWPALHAEVSALRSHAVAWADELASHPDLATQLVDFAGKQAILSGSARPSRRQQDGS